MTLSSPRHAALALGAMLLASQASAQATGLLTGRVVDERSNHALAGVEVSIPAMARSVSTDSSGSFALRDIMAGRYQVVLRKVGYQQSSATITVTGTDGPEQLLRLAPVAAELAKVYVVTAPADRRLATFEAHRNVHLGGSFLTAAQLEKERGRALADVLQAVPGADIVRGSGGTAYFATRRRHDSMAGLCYAAVMVNDVFVYTGEGQPLFDLNSLAPTDILAVEVYNGGATMPLEYNAPRKTCGLLVIFTK